MKYGRESTDTFIYNVSKNLVKEFNNDRSVGFKYPESSDGYAHFLVKQDALLETSNPKLYKIKMSNSRNYNLTYKKDGEWVSCEMSAKEIKKAFDASRTPKKNASTSRVQQAPQSRQTLQTIDLTDNGFDWSDPFTF